MAQLKPDPVVRLLTSFYYWGGHSKDIERLFTLTDKIELFADSGAFSSYMLRGAANMIKREDYAAWLKEHRARFRVMANFDVIGDHKTTAKNQLWFEQQGLPVLPVYHLQSPLSELEALCRDYDYVAIGGAASLRGSQAKVAMTARALMVAREHGTAIHGFGRCAPAELLALPFYSVDSSVVVQATRYGRLQMFDGRSIMALKPAEAVKFPALLRRHSAEPQRIVRRDYGLQGIRTPNPRPLDEYRREKQESIRVGTVAWKLFETHLRQRHKVQPPAGHEVTGPVVYLADNVFTQYSASIQAIHWLATGERSF